MDEMKLDSLTVTQDKGRHKTPAIASQSTIEWATPEMWGVRGVPSGADDTAAVQFALDSGAHVMFMQSYAVSRVTIAGGGRLVDGRRQSLLGKGHMYGVPKTHIRRGTLNAVLEIKCEQSLVQNIHVT